MNNRIEKIIRECKNKLDIIAENSKKSKNSILDIIPIIISIIALIASIVLPLRDNKMESFNKSLLLEEKIVMKDNGDYEIKFIIKQGGVRKAYKVLETEDGLIYERLTNIEDDEIIVIDTSNTETKVLANYGLYNQLEDEKNKVETKENILDGKVSLEKINDFALVILDTTEQWSIYYFISSPEYTPEDVCYEITLMDDSGKTVISQYLDVEKQGMQSVVIDGNLTSVITIDKTMQQLKEDYYLFSAPQTLMGEGKESITINPMVDGIYELPTPEKIYENILQIKKTIHDLS